MQGRWSLGRVFIFILGVGVIALSSEPASTQSKRGPAPTKASTAAPPSPIKFPVRAAPPPLPKRPPTPVSPRPRGNVTRTLNLQDPSGHPVIVALTTDKQLDSRVLDYLASNLKVVDNSLSSAERAAWASAPGSVTMGWTISVAITSPTGRDVSRYMVRPPPGVDLVRPEVLQPSDELVVGLRARPRIPFPETVPRGTTVYSSGSTTITVTGRVACKADVVDGKTILEGGTIRDVEIELHGSVGSWSDTLSTCTAPRSARRVVPRTTREFPFPFPLTSGVMGIGNAEAITDAA